jgi:hypothetical protein
MNKEIKHLYQELSTDDKAQLLVDFKRSPKILCYIQALETFGYVSTQKAIQVIYVEELPDIEQAILTNRFYKLRRTFHIHLLQLLKNSLKSSTDEETELKFLQLLLLKNEHAYVLERAKKLEQKCWENNLFELLPELIHIIISSSHFHQSFNVEEIANYIEKLETANDLLHTLHKFKNYVNTFRLKIISIGDYADLATHYTEIIHKMRRKANSLKKYKRFSLIYHHVGFTIGCQMHTVVHKTGNVLTRHLNQLEKILVEHPQMPIISYTPNHRLHTMDSLLINQALYWYQKGNMKKSYQCILDKEQLNEENSSQYIIRVGNNFHNILLCCWGAKKYEAVLKYAQELKEFQQSNASIKKETPYFIYELLAYAGLFPKKKHPNPLLLIHLTNQFLKDSDEESIWIYDAIGTFALLYGYFEESRAYLEYAPLLKLYKAIPNNILTVELLDLVESNNQKELYQFFLRIRNTKKQAQSRKLISHLNELEMLTKLFL